ncbi:MAG: molybdopterin-dependent oxidoreductase [Streptosporangiaceae bacterium]|nr:molybdopterin-dependent oxidoreductase [Streptosporangiaceae bacterium]
MTRKTAAAGIRVLAGAACGLLAAAVALGLAELLAGITGPGGSPVVAVGGAVIDLTPVPVKDFAIAHFGSHDKQALLVGIVVLLTVAAMTAGVLTLRRRRAGLAILAVFGAAGVTAALTRPGASVSDAIPVLAGVAAAAFTLMVLCRTAMAAFPAARTGSSAARPAAGPDPGIPAADGPGRRRFLIMGTASAAAAAASGVAGQVLAGRFSVAASRARVRLPAPAVPAPAVPSGTMLPVPGLTPFFTANDSFYRVDTDLVLPQVAPESWTLRIDGMVARPAEITFAELLRMPLTEADITLVCVSDEVGGPYAGNARWLGVPLAALLRRAGPRGGADQVLSAGADGMTISTPLTAILDGRDALVAVGMNGQPLPVAHGFPARMVIPGLYGYVSATKWVTRLTLTTFARQRAYWTQRGYAAHAPVKTESRIDIPRPLARIPAGRVTVAGVAWAPARGIAAVEVRADSGPWHTARLAAADGTGTWRQWMWAWDATPGLHQLQVRATDSTGATQTPREAGVFPDGASGWDSVVVTVT